MDMKKKLLFVFNPCSGKAQIKNQLLDIVDTMVKRIMRLRYIRRSVQEMQKKKWKRMPEIMILLCAAVEMVH